MKYNKLFEAKILNLGFMPYRTVVIYDDTTESSYALVHTVPVGSRSTCGMNLSQPIFSVEIILPVHY